MSNEQKSAIIGYWRSGASLEQISWITGIEYWIIEKIINEYSKKINHGESKERVN